MKNLTLLQVFESLNWRNKYLLKFDPETRFTEDMAIEFIFTESQASEAYRLLSELPSNSFKDGYFWFRYAYYFEGYLTVTLIKDEL